MNFSQMDPYQGVQASQRQPLRAEVFMSSQRSRILKPIQFLGFSIFNKTNLDVDSCKGFLGGQVFDLKMAKCVKGKCFRLCCVYTHVPLI